MTRPLLPPPRSPGPDPLEIELHNMADAVLRGMPVVPAPPRPVNAEKTAAHYREDLKRAYWKTSRKARASRVPFRWRLTHVVPIAFVGYPIYVMFDMTSAVFGLRGVVYLALGCVLAVAVLWSSSNS